MVVFDTTMLLHAIDASLPPFLIPDTETLLTDAHPRVNALIGDLHKKRTKIVIPTPALAELLILAGASGAQYLEKLEKSAAFQIEPFETRAAIELAIMTQSAMAAGDKKAGSIATMAKIKFDRQIISIAKVHKASVIYSDDKNLAKFSAAHGIPCVASWNLPTPPAKQPDLLDFLHAGQPPDENK